MTIIEAIILGLIQGLTEFLPVSSSGHLIIGKELFGIELENVSFEVAVHAATVLSTIVALRDDIWKLLCGFFKFEYNNETKYICKIAVSMIPILIVGLFFKDYVVGIFTEGLLLVGIMLLVTAGLLFLSEKMSAKQGDGGRNIGYKEALIIGLSQAVAVIPGLSRSGTTISTGLFCGVKKSEVAKFSFLMVLIPILGEAFLELIGGDFAGEKSGIATTSLICGFVAAFISGFVACKWMINIVKKAKLSYFSIYCLIAGVAVIIISMA